MGKAIWAGTEKLEDICPGLPAGTQAQTHFEAISRHHDRFAVLVIRIDDFYNIVERFGRNQASELIVSLALTAQRLGAESSMLCARPFEDRLAYLCPGLDQQGATALGRKIQDAFADTAKDFAVSVGTVSIGVAIFPFWPFESRAILSNAQKALDHAEFFGPGTITAFDAVSLNISADKLYQYGDIDGAIDEFRKALQIDPGNVNVLNSLGVCFGAAGKFSDAISAFERAMEIAPDDAMATFNLGLAYMRKGQTEKALALLLKAEYLDGGHAEICCQIGICYKELTDIDAALPYLEKATVNNCEGSRAYRELAECYEIQGKKAEAIKAYEKAIKRNPRDAKSLSALGHLYREIGSNLEIAAVLAKQSVAIDPANGLYRLRLGEILLSVEDFNSAIEELRSASELGHDCASLMALAQEKIAASKKEIERSCG